MCVYGSSNIELRDCQCFISSFARPLPVMGKSLASKNQVYSRVRLSLKADLEWANFYRNDLHCVTAVMSRTWLHNYCGYHGISLGIRYPFKTERRLYDMELANVIKRNIKLAENEFPCKCGQWLKTLNMTTLDVVYLF